MNQSAPSHSVLPQVLKLLQAKAFDQARALVKPMLEAHPDDAQLRFAQALIDRETGKLGEALAVIEALHARLPANPMIRAELAATQVMAGQMDKAIPTLKAMVAQQPNAPFGQYWLGQAYLRSFDGQRAIGCFQAMRRLVPGDHNVLQLLAAAHLSIGRAREAEKLCLELLEVQPDRIDTRSTLAAAYEQQSRLEDAAMQYRAILANDPGNAHGVAGLARVLQSQGDRAGARKQLRDAIERDEPEPAAVSTFAQLCDDQADRDQAIEAARRALQVTRYSAQDRAGLYFALARLLDARGEHDCAFEAYRSGNELYPRLYHPSEKEAHTQAIMETFSAEHLAHLPRAKARDNEPFKPIFVLGMPRSGTTLIEQVLAAHSQVYGAGELQTLRTIWRDLLHNKGNGQPGALTSLTRQEVDEARQRYLSAVAQLVEQAGGQTGGSVVWVTDKMPHNFEQLGLIELLFPDARVIHAMRDPMDTCVSTYFTQLSLAHGYATQLESLGHAYNEYRRLMAHWKKVLRVAMLDVSYESMVTDLEHQTKRLLAFVGLDWEDGCLRFYETRRTVKTASVDQVRQPIYTSSVSRWKRYEKHLGPLRRALEQGSFTTQEENQPG